MTKLLIDRELLERLETWVADDCEALRELQAILDASAPAPAVDWREHSKHFARGQQCPGTLETAQAAWQRDQEVIFEQKAEISKLKEKVNQLRQKPAPAGWVPVTERLPQIKQILSEKCTLEGKELPTLYRSGEVITFDGKRVSAGIVEWFHGKLPLSGVTHWMPLPKSPESGHD